jgi:hypothetical protein
VQNKKELDTIEEHPESEEGNDSKEIRSSVIE